MEGEDTQGEPESWWKVPFLSTDRMWMESGVIVSLYIEVYTWASLSCRSGDAYTCSMCLAVTLTVHPLDTTDVRPLHTQDIRAQHSTQAVRIPF